MNQGSFESVQSWLDAVEEVNEDCVKFLVGNKVDLSKNQRKVPLDTALVSYRTASYHCYDV